MKLSFMDETKDVLVEFYAPWCGHCKSPAPIYEKVATTFKLEEDVVIVNLYADKYRDLAEKYDVSGFPTLKFFQKGNKLRTWKGLGDSILPLIFFAMKNTEVEGTW